MSKYLVQATWDDVPHLDETAKAELLQAYPPYQRDARTRGVPQLGSGAIYQVSESDVLVQDFEVPQYYLRAFGMDVGWNRTAVVWGAKDPSSNTIYLYSEHYRGQAEPIVHAMAIQNRGKWIPGVIDPASQGRSQKDGVQLLMQYKEMGLDLEPAVNAVEAGIYAVWQLLSAGKLKVFKSLGNWLTEFRLYQRDTDGRIVKRDDHLMDACVAPDTLVMTDRGAVAIKDLVGVEGWVQSRSGSWARFHGARLVEKDAVVVKVKFEDGSEVVCTPDHPFLTPEGWVRADQMESRYCYNGVSQCQTIQSLCRQPVRYLRDAATLFTGTISGAAEFISTVRYGKRGMINPYLPGMQCTTVTTIEPTMQASIWNSCPVGIMPDIIHGKREISPVCNVGSDFAPNIPAKTSSAPTPVEPGFASRLGWTMRNAVAWLVAGSLWRIATSGNSAARASALLKSCSVANAGRSDVYCLTVPATSSFCLANGAVVHNTRYLIMSGVDRMRLPPGKPKYEQHLVYPGASQSWME